MPPGYPPQAPYPGAPYPSEPTAASSAATHNRFAAVSTTPGQGPAGPAPGGGTTAAGAPPAAYPSPPAPQEPASSVESLLSQASMGEEARERAPTGRERGRERRGRRRKPPKKDLPKGEMQNRAIRLAFIIILVIAVIGYVAGYVRRRVANTEGVLDNGVIDLVGVFALVAAGYLLVKVGRVARKTEERLSPNETQRLGYITFGGLLLWMVPIVGSFGYRFGLVFQTSDMHPVYYGLVFAGVLLLLYGMAGSKERGSFFKVFRFGTYGILVATLPMAFPWLGDAIASDFWWSSSFILISLSFILISMMLRQMRQGQYAQLESVLERADRAFASRNFDEAARHYSEAITLTHTLYSDIMFSGRNPRERGSSQVPEQYFRPWIGKAKCLALTGKLRKALAIYDLMLEVDPNDPRVWFDRGRILVAEKRFAEAYISFDRAVKLAPDFEEAKKGRADVLEVIRNMAP